MDFITKAISLVSPNMAVRREIEKQKLSFFGGGHYRGGNVKNWFSRFVEPKEEAGGIQELRNKTRDSYRNNSLGRGYITTNVNGTIGMGLKLQSEIDNEALGVSNEEAEKIQNEIERRFKVWANSKECDLRRACNFYELQGLAFKTMLLSGDCFATIPFDRIGEEIKLKIALYESEDVSYSGDGGLGIYDGIRYNRGRPVEYIFNLGDGEKKVKAYKKNGLVNCIHLFQVDRPGQVRGIPYLAPILKSLHHIDKFTEAELTGALVGALLSVFIKNDSPSGGMPLLDPIDDGGDSDSGGYDLGSGSVLELNKNQSIEIAESKRPNKNFDGFVNSVANQISSSLGIPNEVVQKRFENSYSASRAALIQAYELFSINKSFMVSGFCNPIYKNWMFTEVVNNGLRLDGFLENEKIRNAYLGAKWVGSTIPSIDPLKEAKAVQIRTDIGLTTMSEETSQYSGGDFVQNIQKIDRENKMKRQAGLVSSGTELTDREENED